MRWNNKKRKIFIFIVSLLFILQIFSVLGSAGRLDEILVSTLKDMEDSGKETNVEETGDDENLYSSSNTGSSSSTSTINTGSSSLQSIITDSSSSDAVSSDVTELDPDKYDIYASSLTPYPTSANLNIGSNLMENSVELKLTDSNGYTVSGTFNTMGTTYSTDNGPVYVDVSKVSDCADSIFVSATADGVTSYEYIDITEDNPENSINNEVITMFSSIFNGMRFELKQLFYSILIF